jgi:flagellar basal body-associated protein FliL
MERKQMMSRLLAEIRTGQEHLNEMKDEIKVDMNANRKPDQEERKAERKADREDLKEMMEEMMNIKLKEMREEIKTGQEEIRSIVNAWIADMQIDRLETTACHEEMEAYTEKTQLDPKMMQSVAEHQ